MGTQATRAEMRTALVRAFEKRGWDYDSGTGRAVLDGVRAGSTPDTDSLARLVPTGFLARTGADRAAVAGAIQEAIGELELVPDSTTVGYTDNRSYSVVVEGGSQITGSQLNLGGTQINISADSPKADVLGALCRLVAEGLDGSWDADAVQEIAALAERRGDISTGDVTQAIEPAGDAGASPERLERAKRMLESIAEKSITGAVGAGLTHVLLAVVAAL